MLCEKCGRATGSDSPVCENKMCARCLHCGVTTEYGETLCEKHINRKPKEANLISPHEYIQEALSKKCVVCHTYRMNWPHTKWERTQAVERTQRSTRSTKRQGDFSTRQLAIEAQRSSNERLWSRIKVLRLLNDELIAQKRRVSNMVKKETTYVRWCVATDRDVTIPQQRLDRLNKELEEIKTRLYCVRLDLSVAVRKDVIAFQVEAETL